MTCAEHRVAGPGTAMQARPCTARTIMRAVVRFGLGTQLDGRDKLNHCSALPDDSRQTSARIQHGHPHTAAGCRTERPEQDQPPIRYALIRDCFTRWWQVLGSNQRRLSRRFYRLPPTTFLKGSDLRILGSGDIFDGIVPCQFRAQRAVIRRPGTW
jgi:hypothetical protein